MPKQDKPELIIQKCTELGAARIVFFISKRCVSRPDEKSAEKKISRYRKIAEETIYGAPSLANGTYIIESALDNNKVLDIDGAKTNTGANLQLWDKNYTNAQKFYVEYIGEGYYTIKALCSGKYLDVEGAKKDCGTNVWQYDRNNNDSQKA